MKIIWIDVETTGLNPKIDTIIELAAIYEDTRKTEPLKIFHKYCLPKYKPGNFDYIKKLTGITWDFLKKHGLKEAVLLRDFKEFLGKFINKFNINDKAIFAAYYARFDNDFIRELFNKYNDNYFGSWFYPMPLDILSTVILAFKNEIISKLENFKNIIVAKHLKFNDFLAHNALSDIQTSRKIQLKLEAKL